VNTRIAASAAKGAILVPFRSPREVEVTQPKHIAMVLLVVPMLSIGAVADALAAKNDNRFQQSVEAKHAKICTELKDSYDFNMNYYNEKPKKRGKWKTTAENIKTLAEGNDCGWAM
jgi:hypothetical protein